jgi:CBS domain containing-hemolysin-like protein
MDVHSIVAIISLPVLLLLSAYFAAAEIAFSALNRIRIKNAAEGGLKRAKLVLSLYGNYDKLLSTILVGNTIVNIAAASIATVLFIKHFDEAGAMISTVVITVAVLFFGEVTPKRIAKESPEKYALLVAPLLHLLMVFLTPINFIFSRWARFLGRVFKSPEEDKSITEEELLSIVEEAEHEGAIDEEDAQMIQSVIEYNDLQAYDILTPRMEVVGASRETSIDELTALFLKSGYSRIPIYEDSLDNIVGIVHLRDFFDYVINQKGDPDSIIQPAVFVAPSIKINELLKFLQKEKVHMAIVADEYGGTSGIVTMEDILEELVGEIWDESDEVVEEFFHLKDGRYKIAGSAEVDKMFELFGLKGEVEASTVSGWIMDVMEKIPKKGDTFTHGHLTITVGKVEQRRTVECFVKVGERELEG